MTEAKEESQEPYVYDEDEDEPDPDEYCDATSGKHSFKILSGTDPDDTDIVIEICRRCQKFRTKQVRALIFSFIDPLRITNENQASNIEHNIKRIATLEAEIETKQGEFESQQAAISELQGEVSQLLQQQRGVAYAAQREALAIGESERLLTILGSLIPLMNREQFPLADVVAMYHEMADRVHRFASGVRSTNPSHPAWTQMDALGVGGVLIRERKQYLMKIGDIYRLSLNPHEDLNQFVSEIRAMTSGMSDTDE